ncbi:MAG: hypothetical protein AAGG68_30900 [Bacteroidota bacterium]
MATSGRGDVGIVTGASALSSLNKYFFISSVDKRERENCNSVLDGFVDSLYAAHKSSLIRKLFEDSILGG